MEKILHQITDSKEKLFIKTILEYADRAEKQNRAFFTDFYSVAWMKQVIDKHLRVEDRSRCQFFGGYLDAERQILGIFPRLDDEMLFPITCLKIIVKTGIGKSLSHRDFLGALLGLGIERDKIGDIIIEPFGAFIIIKENMADYVFTSLTSIGKYQNIEISIADFTDLNVSVPKTKDMHTTVASLRLDVIVSAGFGISRAESLKLIQSDKAKCNGMDTSASYLLKEGDHVTLRGYGKIKLKQINGTTKKDRIHVCIEKYI